MHPELIYSAPFFITAAFILAVGVFAFGRRRVRGAWYLTLGCVSGAVWATFEGTIYLGLGLHADVWFTYLQYLGALPFVVFGLFFTLSTFGFERWITAKTITLITVSTVLMLALIWTDPLHHLVYRHFYSIESEIIPLRGIERGPLWWVMIGYQYLLGLLICSILVHAVVTSSHVLRAQAGLILVTAVIVWIVNAVYVAGYSPLPGMDISPLAFIFVALSMAWGFFRYRLLDIVPIAKSQIYRNLSDPVIVLDNRNRIVNLNPAAGPLLNIPRKSHAVGLRIEDLFEGRRCKLIIPEENQKAEFSFLRYGREHFFDLQTSILHNRQGHQIGRILIFQEVTEHKLAAQAIHERERLQGVLEMAGSVSHDLSQPVMAILGYAELIKLEVSADNPLHSEIAELARQAEKISEITQKLMRITRYETRAYQGGRIIDIDRASTTAIDD